VRLNAPSGKQSATLATFQDSVPGKDLISPQLSVASIAQLKEVLPKMGAHEAVYSKELSVGNRTI